jgi:hypothetical protein
LTLTGICSPHPCARRARTSPSGRPCGSLEDPYYLRLYVLLGDEISIHSLTACDPVIDGEHDWMDPQGGYDAVENMRKAGNGGGKMYIVPAAGHHRKPLSSASLLH